MKEETKVYIAAVVVGIGSILSILFWWPVVLYSFNYWFN